MNSTENYRDQEFLVADPDARVRDPDDLWTFLKYQDADQIPPGFSVGDYVLVPEGTLVSVNEVVIVPAGKRHRYFAHVSSTDGSHDFGWTSTTNFLDKFRNVTLGTVEPKVGAGQYAETAAWSRGAYIGQVTLVNIVDNGLELERLTLKMVDPFFAMVRAARADAINIVINSGFRTYAAQKYLYDNWKKGAAGFNKAAKPGRSNHQNGIALDIPVGGSSGTPVYDWLAENATSFGFIRTVKDEYWHWEYRPNAAEKAKQLGQHTSWN